jgi:hypothetical protein
MSQDHHILNTHPNPRSVLLELYRLTWCFAKSSQGSKAEGGKAGDGPVESQEIECLERSPIDTTATSATFEQSRTNREGVEDVVTDEKERC